MQMYAELDAHISMQHPLIKLCDCDYIVII